MNTEQSKRKVGTWLTAMLLTMMAWVIPQGAWSADGIFDTPSQAFSWYSKGPGCIHLKILVHDASAKRSLKNAYFGLKDAEGSVDFLKVAEESSSNKSWIQAEFHNLLAKSDGQIIHVTNDDGTKPFNNVGTTPLYYCTVSRESSNGNCYAELDWYYPSRLAGRKMTLFLHDASVWEVGDGKQHKYEAGNKDLGTITFDDIMFEAYDAFPGTEAEDASMIRIPVASDHAIEWLEVTYEDAHGTKKTLPRITLEQNSYSAFINIPANEAHHNVTITGNIVMTSLNKDDFPDKSWSSVVAGPVTIKIGTIGMVHGPKFLKSEVDSVGSVVLSWQVPDPKEEDLLDGDVFDIQRSLTGKEEDFQSLQAQVMYEQDSATYTFIDSTLVSSLTAELIDAQLGIPLVRYRVIRAATQQLWGIDKNCTSAYTQPQFTTLSLPELEWAKAAWSNEEEHKVNVSWEYKKSSNSVIYVWDDRAEMRVEMLLYNRAGQRVDSIARVLTEAERRAKKVELQLPRSCVKYEMNIVVDGKTSPIGKGEGEVYIQIRNQNDWDKFIGRIDSGNERQNAILINDVTLGSGADIPTSENKPFKGVFEGNGHSLDIQYTWGNAHVAPLRYMGQGAIVAHLTLKGRTSGQNSYYSALATVVTGGKVFIEDCRVSATIKSGMQESYASSFICSMKSPSLLYMNNCLFDGCITWDNPYNNKKTQNIGGFISNRPNGAFVSLNNCYFNPSSIDIEPSQKGCFTFVRNTGDASDTGGIRLTDCYYKTKMGTAQGSQSDTAPDNWCWKNGAPVVKQMAFSTPLHDTTCKVGTPDHQFYFQSTGKIDPTSLEATTNLQKSVLLKWQKTEGTVDYFEVWRRTIEEDGEWEMVDTQLSDLEYEDKTVSPVYTYQYKVCSINDCEGRDSTFTEIVPGNCIQTGKVEGFVCFSDGTGIPNVRVTASPSGSGADPLLSRSCVTDESGFYSIDSLKYWGPQVGNYQLTLTGVSREDLADNCQDGIPVTFNDKTNYEKNYSFTVTKGVRFSGLVMYRGTSIPVHGAHFMVDGLEVRSGRGPVESDFEGKFSFRMLKAPHTIQAVMDGHDFYQEGFYYENNQKDDIYFGVDVAQVYFYDDTRVKLIGRVAGGKKQGELPLGNSLSTNNLGDNLKMVLTLEGDNASWLVFDNLHRSIIERDTTYIHQKHSSLDKNEYHTRVHTTRHRMEVWPDSLTGEYQVELPPVKWKIQQITADGYATLFQEGKTSDVIDLTDSLTLHTDVITGEWRSRAGEDITQVEEVYHAKYNRIYRSPVLLERKQVGFDKFDYFGEKSFTMRTLTGEKHTIDIAYPVTTTDAKTKKEFTTTKYTFSYPVFSTDRGYGIQLSAVERYYYNNNVQSDTVDVVKLDGGLVTIRNGFISGTHRDTLSLDQNGEGNYVLRAEQRPYLLTGKDALQTVTFTLERDGVTFEGEPLKGYVFSQYAKQGAKDILSINTPVLVDILRDPPGSGSSAKLTKGSTLKLAYQMDMAWKGGVSIGIKAGSGQDFYTGLWAGIGTGGNYGQVGHSKGVFNTSVDIVFSGTGQRAFSYTLTAAEDISTDTGSTMVGANADLYMGMETNLFVRPAVAIQAINDSVFRVNGGNLASGRMVEIARGYGQQGDTLHLVRTEVLGYGQTLESTFVHSQQYIVKQLIPSLAKECEDLMFTGTREEAEALANALGQRIYLSLINDKKSENFATLNTDAKNNYVYNTTNKDHQHTDQSKMNYIIVLPNGDDGSVQEDKVKDICNTMSTWINMIARNEREKLEATNKMKNFEVDGGGTVSYSEDFATEYSNTTSYNWFATDFTHNYFANPDPDKDDYGDIERTRFAMAEMLTILGNTAGKFLASMFATKNIGGSSVESIERNTTNPLSEYDISFVGLKWSLNLTPVAAFAVTPKNNETTKYNRKESFTIKMDKKSHLDFDVYYATPIDSRADTEVDSRTDVFVEENFLNNVDYMEYFLDRDVGSRDIVHDMVKPRGFLYRTRGGATVRTWENERKTLFYRHGTVLDERTKKIENPVIKMDKQSISGVPMGEPARFKLYMTNESEHPEAIGGSLQYFTLYHDETTNPHGARLIVDGLPLSRNGITVEAVPGKVNEKTLEVYAGEDFDYENLKIGLISPGDVQCVQEVSFSVHYLRTAGNVEIATPGDKWIMNTDAPFDNQHGWYMPIIISGFDKNQKNFDHIELQYKESTRGDDYWTNLCAFYADSTLYKQATGTHEMIPENGNIVTKFYGEGTVMEKAYDLRARLYCRNGNNFITNDSKVLSGIKDTRRPQLFGTPEPINGIVGAGENIIFNFSEAIEHNYLQQATNFQVVGETNETALTEEPSLLFTGSGYAETDARRNFANKNMTIDLMVRPDEKNVAMPIFSHGTDGRRLQLWITEDWHLRAVIDSITFESTKTLKKGMLQHVALILDNDHKQAMLYNDSIIGSYDSVVYNGYGSLIFGATNEVDTSDRKHYSGRMLEARLWNRAMTESLLNTYGKRLLTGFELGLANYYPMNDGESNYAIDKAQGANAELHGADWALPQGMSLSLDFDEQKPVKGMQIDHKLMERSTEQDYTLMFWFKTNKRGQGALLSNGSGRKTDADAVNKFFIGFEAGQLKYRTNGREFLLGTQWADDRWHHFALTVDRSHKVASLYVDRELRSSFATDTLGGMRGDDFYVGNMVWHNAGADSKTLHSQNALTGHIDEIALFAQALPYTLLKRYSTKSPSGQEKGLLIHMGFNHQERQLNNNLELRPFALNSLVKYDKDGNPTEEHDSVFVEPVDYVLQHIDQSYGAHVQASKELRNLNFSFVGRNNSLLVNIDELDSRINKRNVYVTVTDIPDMNGNYMASPATVEFFIDRNPLRWECRSRSEEIHEMGSRFDDDYMFDVKVLNNSGTSHIYTVKDLPRWLTVDKETDVIDPQGEHTLHFSVSKDLNVGSYDEIIYLTDENGLAEPLALTIRKDGETPTWIVDEERKHFSMNLVGQVRLGDALVTDKEDMVGAFDSQGRCMGVAYISHNPNTSQTQLFLTIFDDEAQSNKSLTFKLWHHQTGQILLLETDRKVTFAASEVVGSVDAPVMMTAGSLYYQQLSVSPGWNWISFNVANKDYREPLKMLSQFSWQDGDIVTDDTDDFTFIYNEELGMWLSNKSGDMEGMMISTKRSYRVYVKRYDAAEIPGSPLKEESQRTIPVKHGWNNIGYTPLVNLPVSTAMADYTGIARNHDVLKSREEFAVFTETNSGGGYWSGSLQYMKPGEGYMLYRNSESTASFHYPYYEPGSVFFENTSAKMRTPQSYAHNMSLAASIEGIELQEGDHLLAFSDGELRGEAVAIDSVYYLSIAGEEKAPLSFAIEREGEIIATTADVMSYESNAIIGSPTAPTAISFVHSDLPQQDGWYTIAGHKLQGKPQRKGVYIFNGKKQIIK